MVAVKKNKTMLEKYMYTFDVNVEIANTSLTKMEAVNGPNNTASDLRD